LDYRLFARCVFGVAYFLLAARLAHAARVTDIQADGTLEIDGREYVRLAGIDPAPEASNLLKVLVLAKEVEIVSQPGPTEQAKQHPGVYLYVQTAEIPFPFAQEEKSLARRVLVNELLLRLGAARVSDTVSQEWKKKYHQAQQAAKTGGEEVWS